MTRRTQYVATLLLTVTGCARNLVVERGEGAERPTAPLVTATEEGVASWYGDAFKGRPTASGEAFDPTALTAAHRTLPFGSCVLVQSVDASREVKVRINDRGPFVAGRVIDLSQRAAQVLGIEGVAPVRLLPCR